MDKSDNLFEKVEQIISNLEEEYRNLCSQESKQKNDPHYENGELVMLQGMEDREDDCIAVYKYFSGSPPFEDSKKQALWDRSQNIESGDVIDWMIDYVQGNPNLTE